MTTRQKQLDLVRKCLALAKSPVPAEAAAAQKKAYELMAKWNIAQIDLVQDAPPTCPGCSRCRPSPQAGAPFFGGIIFGSVFVNGEEFVPNGEGEKDGWATYVRKTSTPLTRADIENMLNDFGAFSQGSFDV